MNKLSINRARRMVRPPRRIMRDPDDHGNQPGGGDNQQVNQGDSSNTGDDSNNTGDDADLDAFWNGQADESGDGSNPGGDDNGDSNQSDTATQLGEMLNGFDPGALFNDEIATQINEGNFKGFQERFTNSMRASIRQTMTMRSEEHTSELQTLMRISYAVFCLKKKKV